MCKYDELCYLREVKRMKWGSKVLAFLLGISLLVLTLAADLRWH